MNDDPAARFEPMTRVIAPPRPRPYDKAVALVLQGGGALGSYQAGVFEGIAGSQYSPDWVAGISIGAINAAIIAGSSPDKRVEKLRAFWEEVTSPTSLWPAVSIDSGTDRRIGALHALFLGQPGFFTPRPPVNWLLGQSPISYYDTAPLRSTLERLVDFDRINAKEMRFSVAAVNVHTGNLRWFDNAHMEIKPEHVMASGALPPGFPPVSIDDELYWDAALVSNTPLQYIVENYPRRSRLIFQVDVFQASGPLPANLEEVGEREKDIRYSSRTRAVTTMLRHMHDLRYNISMLWDLLPPEVQATPQAQFLRDWGCNTTMDIVQLIYRPDHLQGESKDYQFSRAAMRARWERGIEDARVTLRASPWLAPPPPETGARSFDVLRPEKAP